MYLPVSVLAGVVIHVGFNMVDWRIISWLRSPKARVDGILALSVIAATVIFDVATGVGVGAIGSALLFIRGQSGATAIHERASGKERRSLCHRSKSERTLLDAHGNRILYIELRGHLFFGSVDRLFTELNGDLRRPVWIVINMRRVLSLDMSGLNLLHQMMALIAAHGGQILFANIYPGIVPNRKMSKLLRLLGTGDKGFKAKTFKSSDKALQHAEDELLTELTGSRPTGPSKRVEADENELCRNMRPKTKATLRKILKPVNLRSKERFYSTGDQDHALFLVVQGEGRRTPADGPLPLQTPEARGRGRFLRRDDVSQSGGAGDDGGRGRRGRGDGARPGSGQGGRGRGQGSDQGLADRTRLRVGRTDALG